MEINYRTIIQYLCKNEIENGFSTKKNIMTTSDSFPKKFIDHLNQSNKKTFYRYGITKYNKNQNNISFYNSLFTLIDKKFITLDDTEELLYLKDFKEDLVEKIKDKNFKFELSEKFGKQVILDRIKSDEILDGILVQTISQIIGINFLIFDFENENIYTIFPEDHLDPWRVTIFFAKYKDFWEPIFSEKKQYSFNDIFLKKLFTSQEIEYYHNSFLEKDYVLLDNIKEIIENKTVNLEDSDNESNESSDIMLDNEDTFVNPINEKKEIKLNKTKLRKMKKVEIIDIIDQLNLNILTSIKKDDLICELLNHLN